jgi:hypothetical protein
MNNIEQAEFLKQKCVTVIEARDSIEIVFNMNAATFLAAGIVTAVGMR